MVATHKFLRVEGFMDDPHSVPHTKSFIRRLVISVRWENRQEREVVSPKLMKTQSPVGDKTPKIQRSSLLLLVSLF